MPGAIGQIGRMIGQIGASAPGRGGGLSAFMASQADGLWYDFSRISSLSQDTVGATPVTAFGDVIGRVLDLRTGANSPRNATQATVSAKPKYQSTGAVFDGADDNLLSGFVLGAGASFIVAKLTVPASLPALHVIAGSRDADANTRGYLSLDLNGRVCAGIGSQGSAVITAAGDFRGQTATLGVTANGSTVRLFANGAQVYQAAQLGVPSATASVRVGALNDNGTANNFFVGSVKALVLGRQYLDLATFNQIAAAL